MQTEQLLKRCAENQQAASLAEADIADLRRWNSDIDESSRQLTVQLLLSPMTDWENIITEHQAHQHPWYDYVADQATINDMARFLLENSDYPVFLNLLKAIQQVQFTADGAAAVSENIVDEHQPEPHAELMRRMMQAVKSRASNSLYLGSYPSLINRTLVFYYGYYCEPWHLVGSVFATERMGTRRVICMDRGLRRLGLSDHDLAFTIIHSECDEHHAADGLERVSMPSVKRQHDLKANIARGIASCLQTSKQYLDDVLQWATHKHRREPEYSL